MQYGYRDYHSYPKFQIWFSANVEGSGRKNYYRMIDSHAKFSTQPGFSFLHQRNILNFSVKVVQKKKVVYQTYPNIIVIIFR